MRTAARKTHVTVVNCADDGERGPACHRWALHGSDRQLTCSTCKVPKVECGRVRQVTACSSMLLSAGLPESEALTQLADRLTKSICAHRRNSDLYAICVLFVIWMQLDGTAKTN